MTAEDAQPGTGAPLAGGDRRQLHLVVAITLAAFALELAIGAIAGSQAAVADSLDLLGNGLALALAVWAIGRPPAARAAAELLRALMITALGLWVALAILYRIFVEITPDPAWMSAAGLVALGANGAVLQLLWRHRAAGSALHGTWLMARNDMLGNAAVILAGGVVALLGTPAADLVVAGVVVALTLDIAGRQLLHAWHAWTARAEPGQTPS